MNEQHEPVPDIAAIEAAATRIRPHVHRTPVLTCRTLNRMCEAEIFFKCENLQRVGAFKMRGAANAIFSLADDRAQRGVATHSSGNHAQALAQAAQRAGIAAWVVMPSNAPAIKRAAVADYGAQIISCQPSLAAREAKLAEVIARTGATFVHPYDDYQVIAGQATCAHELCQQVPDLEAVLAPVGGGGLLSGTALAVAALCPQTRVLGVEPLGADDACRSLQAGRIIPSRNPATIADGLLTSLGQRNFPIIRRLVSAILTVSDPDIVRAMRLIFERMKMVVEPSAAVPLAALLTRRAAVTGHRIGIILSGGNVDLDHLPWQAKPRGHPQ